MRRIRPGQSIWSASQAGRAKWRGAFIDDGPTLASYLNATVTLSKPAGR